eukprot:144318-Hanusia_phi.AAC.1
MPLKKSRSGSYIGMSLINPHYTESDLTPLRSVQAVYDKDIGKSFAKLGLNVVGSSGKAAGQKSRTKQEMREWRERKGLRQQEGRKQQGKKAAQAGDDRKDVKEVLTYCVEAFANCLLTDQGNVTFQELYLEFVKNFPFAEKEPSFSVRLARSARLLNLLPPAATVLWADLEQVVQGEEEEEEEGCVEEGCVERAEGRGRARGDKVAGKRRELNQGHRKGHTNVQRRDASWKGRHGREGDMRGAGLRSAIGQIPQRTNED